MAAKSKWSGGAKKVVRPHGQLRRSQVVGATGPGALLDLPRHAVIVGGLDGWGIPGSAGFERIDDERTRLRLERQLEIKGLQLFSPPVEGDTFGSEIQPGLTVWAFPRWFIAQHEVTPGVRPLVHARQLEKGKYLSDDRKSYPVVPVRFVRACKHGHIDDIDWKAFAHRGDRSCSRGLRWSERGASGDFVDIFVSCECAKFPPLSIIEATKRDPPALGWCNGKRPWLGNVEAEDCKSEDGKAVPFRFLVRNASNAYFSLMDRTISVPEPDQKLRSAVGKLDLSRVEKVEDLAYERRSAKVNSALGSFPDAEVFAELERRKKPGAVDLRGPKIAELETFLAVKGVDGDDSPDSVFFARELVLPAKRSAVLQPISKVLLIDRLREVSVQVGFTRFEAPSAEISGELDLQVRSGSLAREVSWLPAVENRGEGIFLGFDAELLKAWTKRARVIARKKQLDAGYAVWSANRKMKRPPPPLEYLMLHSLSHLLMTALALECGYSASSIRERVYALETGYGILLHTGSPDAEGTLGGLVNAAQNLEGLLTSALELARLCSNDPVCAHHAPENTLEERFLHGAACHGCLLVPETSCESRNDFLDRSLVVETVESLGCELFG